MSVFRGDVRRRGADSRASHIEIRPELAHQHTHDIGVAVVARDDERCRVAVLRGQSVEKQCGMMAVCTRRGMG